MLNGSLEIINYKNLITLNNNKKIYFASDNHLGVPDYVGSRDRELKFVKWLDKVKDDAAGIFLLGDLFDFWFEYKSVIPKGFTRTFGKLAEISDSGIPIHFFVGNHDMWMKDYFKKELNISVHYNPKEFIINKKSFFIGHGDGLGPSDRPYKRLKKIFTNSFFQFLFKWIHPDIGIPFAKLLSQKHKNKSQKDNLIFKDNESEWLTQYCKKKLIIKRYDYFVFGHRHLPLEVPLDNFSTYYNLGDWISHFSYCSFDGEKMELKKA